MRQGHKPYRFTRLSPAEVSAGLDEFKMSVGDYCRVTGTGPKTVQKWLDGEEEPPHQVAANFATWRIPGALNAAINEAEKRRVES